MTRLDELRILRWERIRQEGMLRFVLFRGVLLFGLSLGIVTWAFGDLPDEVPVALVFVLWLVAGALWGLGMWYVSMWGLKRAKKRGGLG